MKLNCSSNACIASTVFTSQPVIGFTDRSSDMSGLRDLFVWKQKATTDAPDTYNA